MSVGHPPRRSVQQCLRAGRPAVGMSLRSGSPTVAEMLAAMDFDFVFIDMEHTPYASFESLTILMAAIEARGGSPWVRVPYFDTHIIGKVAELGAHGIVVPHLQSAAQAQAAVDAVRWPPSGSMGVGTRVRQFDHNVPWQGMDPDDILAAVDRTQREIMVVGLIEEAETLQHLDEILDTDVDGLFPGSTDMAFTLGDPSARLRPGHPAVQAAIEQVVDACRRHGKPAMFGNLSALRLHGETAAEAIATWAAKGVGIFQASVDLEVLLAWGNGLIKEIADARSTELTFLGSRRG